MGMKKQQGHIGIIIVVIVLVVALLGALGYIFWTHFINKPTTQSQATTTTAKASTTESCTTEEQVCFNLPKDWVLDKQTSVAPDGSGNADADTFKDPGGTVVGDLEGITGVGGTCDDTQPISSYTVIKNTATAAIPKIQ